MSFENAAALLVRRYRANFSVPRGASPRSPSQNLCTPRGIRSKRRRLTLPVNRNAIYPVRHHSLGHGPLRKSITVINFFVFFFFFFFLRRPRHRAYGVRTSQSSLKNLVARIRATETCPYILVTDRRIFATTVLQRRRRWRDINLISSAVHRGTGESTKCNRFVRVQATLNALVYDRA